MTRSFLVTAGVEGYLSVWLEAGLDMVLRALCTAIGGCPGEVPFSVSVGPCSDAVLMPGSTLPAPRDGPRSAAEGGRDLSVCSTPVVVPEGDQLEIGRAHV